MNTISSMVSDILMNEITFELAQKIQRALNINKHLTSTYALEVSVDDMYSNSREADPSAAGFYIKLEGTRSGVNFFYNNNLEIARKPSPSKAHVEHAYTRLKGFEESFWYKWADKWVVEDDEVTEQVDRDVVEVLQNKELYMKPTSFIVNNAMSRDVDRMFGDRIKNREVLEKNKIKYTIPYDGDLEYFLNRYKIRSLVEKIVKKSDGYYVTSEDGKKNLGGPYDNEDKAKERLQQVHYFKDKKNKDHLKMKEAFPWGEEDSFFTREDIDEFTSELQDNVPEGVVIGRGFVEPDNMLEVDWSYEGYEETSKVKIDMRKIKLPSDLIKRFLKPVKEMIDNRVKEIDEENAVGESLKEAEGKRFPGFEYIIFELDDNGEYAPIKAIRSTRVEAEYLCAKLRKAADYDTVYNYEKVPKGKFHVGDDFWGPFDDDYNKIESLKESNNGWNDSWRDNIPEDVYLRLGECRNFYKDLPVMAAAMMKANPDKTADECLSRILTWVCEWNSQWRLYPEEEGEYEALLKDVETITSNVDEPLREEKMDITDEVNAAYERITKKFPDISDDKLEDRLYSAVANILSGYNFVDGDKSKKIDTIVNNLLKNKHNKVDESLTESIAVGDRYIDTAKGRRCKVVDIKDVNKEKHNSLGSFKDADVVIEYDNDKSRTYTFSKGEFNVRFKKESLNEAQYSYLDNGADEKLVRDSYNHFVNDLGITPTVDDIFEDIMTNYDQDMFEDDSLESTAQAIKDIRAILRRLDLEYLDESLTEDVYIASYSGGGVGKQVEIQAGSLEDAHRKAVNSPLAAGYDNVTVSKKSNSPVYGVEFYTDQYDDMNHRYASESIVVAAPSASAAENFYNRYIKGHKYLSWGRERTPGNIKKVYVTTLSNANWKYNERPDYSKSSLRFIESVVDESLTEAEGSTDELSYDQKQTIRRKLYEIINRNWLTIFSDEWLRESSIDVTFSNQGTSKKVLQITFDIRKNPYYPVAGYGWDKLDKLKKDLAAFGLKNIKVKTKKVKPRWEDNVYLEVLSISANYDGISAFSESITESSWNINLPRAKDLYRVEFESAKYSTKPPYERGIKIPYESIWVLASSRNAVREFYLRYLSHKAFQFDDKPAYQIFGKLLDIREQEFGNQYQIDLKNIKNYSEAVDKLRSGEKLANTLPAIKLVDVKLTEGANGSVEDYLKQMKKTGNPEKVMKDAKGNPNAEKAYKQFKDINNKSLTEDADESAGVGLEEVRTVARQIKKRMQQDPDLFNPNRKVTLRTGKSWSDYYFVDIDIFRTVYDEVAFTEETVARVKKIVEEELEKNQVTLTYTVEQLSEQTLRTELFSDTLTPYGKWGREDSSNESLKEGFKFGKQVKLNSSIAEDIIENIFNEDEEFRDEKIRDLLYATWTVYDSTGSGYRLVCEDDDMPEELIGIEIEVPTEAVLDESLKEAANDYPTDPNKLKARLREINKAIERGEDPEYFAYEKKKIFDQLDSLGSNYYDESLKEAADTEDGHEQTDERMLLAVDELTGWEFVHYPYANPSKPPYLHPYMVSKGNGEYLAFSPKISWSEAWDEWRKVKADARRESTGSNSGSENNGAGNEKIREIISRCMPKDTKYYTFDFEIDDEEINLHCIGTEEASSLAEDSCEKIDLKVIDKMEAWVKKIDKLLPDLNASLDLGTDWFSGMSVGGESGPFTYNGFTYTIDTGFNESLKENVEETNSLDDDEFDDDYDWSTAKAPKIGITYTDLVDEMMQYGIDIVNDYDPTNEIKEYVKEFYNVSRYTADYIADVIVNNCYNILNMIESH